jgi:hypothetical protein
MFLEKHKALIGEAMIQGFAFLSVSSVTFAAKML